MEFGKLTCLFKLPTLALPFLFKATTELGGYIIHVTARIVVGWREARYDIMQPVHRGPNSLARSMAIRRM